MERRKFIIGAGALATGASAAVGTGAFSSVQADRDVTVEIADDSEAYLAFNDDTFTSGNSGVFADYENGELVIDFGATDGGGQGVNQNTITDFDDVFGINNQGTQEVEIWFELSEELEEWVDFYAVAGNNDGPLASDETLSLVGEDNASSGPGFGGLGDGQQLRVGISIDLRDDDTPGVGELEGEVTVNARAL